MSRQQANGEWLQEGIEGVFNRTWYVLILTNSSPTQIWRPSLTLLVCPQHDRLSELQILHLHLGTRDVREQILADEREGLIGGV
jgi:hypothetical protein